MFIRSLYAVRATAACTCLLAGLVPRGTTTAHAQSGARSSREAASVIAIDQIADTELAWAVARAARGAQRRLRRDTCERVVDVFATTAGRPVRDVLADLQATAPAALSRVIFRDGQQSPSCRGSVAAFTGAGSRVVFVCGKVFGRMSRAVTELIVIHELLHTLGVGERPPRSDEIDQAVAMHCH